MSEFSITDWAKMESILWEARADSTDVAALVEQPCDGFTGKVTIKKNGDGAGLCDRSRAPS